MSRRTGAGLLALCLLAVLWGAAAVVPLPYVTYYPGPTVDILAQHDGDETVSVTGHRAYHDAGELRMTTVYVSQPEDDVTLPELVLRHILAHPAVSTVIPGMRKLRHVEQNIGVSDEPPLPEPLLAELRTHRWNRTVDWE